MDDDIDLHRFHFYLRHQFDDISFLASEMNKLFFSHPSSSPSTLTRNYKGGCDGMSGVEQGSASCPFWASPWVESILPSQLHAKLAASLTFP